MAPNREVQTSCLEVERTSRRTLIKCITGSALGGLIAINHGNLSARAGNRVLVPNAVIEEQEHGVGASSVRGCSTVGGKPLVGVRQEGDTTGQ